uniref:hypothetical protein n=2 Tax=Flavobacterium sp. TaxID=239 RepID=UPI00404AE0E5
MISLLPVMYYTITVCCLGASFINKVSRQNFVWIYFLLVNIMELGNRNKVILPEIYNLHPLAYGAFFTFYFSNQKNSNKKIIYSVGITAFIICLTVLIKNGLKTYSIGAGLSASFLYISLSLYWLFNQLNHVDKNSLLKKQAFWFSTSILIWSVVFLFRIIPMYWLDVHDHNFLKNINYGFQIITILTYGMFLRGLFCKI